MKPLTKAVIAGSYGEYLHYCRMTGLNRNDKDSVFYVDSPESLAGRVDIEIVLVGTYYKRSLPIRYLYERAKISRSTE